MVTIDKCSTYKAVLSRKQPRQIENNIFCLKLRNPKMSANMNATVNGTQPPSCASPNDLGAEKIGKTVAYYLILVVSLAGNSLIGIIVYKTKTMRRTINYLIVNMAMSDLLFPIFVFPSILADLYGGFSYQLGQAFCNAIGSLQFVSANVSIQSLVLIAVDRFGAVVFPLRPPLIRSKLCPFFILGTWVVATTLSFPIFRSHYKSVDYKYTGKATCFWIWKEFVSRDTYSNVLSFAFAAISFLLIIIFYSIVIFKLKSQRIPGEPSNNAEEQRVRRHRKVVKMAASIVIGFALCWGPLNVFIILNVFVWDNTTWLSCGIINRLYIVLFISHVNGALNPCICFTFSGNYRQGLKGLLGCYG